MSGFDKYHGVYPVVPTPLKEDESLDLAGAEHLVEYYITEGCHGLLILGSGGESPYFSLDEKCSVVETVAQKVKKPDTGHCRLHVFQPGRNPALYAKS